MSLFDLTGRKAIVTGGTRGLGRGMAEALLDAGAEVLIVGASESAVTVAAELTAQGQQCQGLAIDLLDILVNAAGVQKRHQSEDFPVSEFEEVLSVNLTAVFELSQLAGRVMLQQGHGKIINIASLLSFFGGYTVPAYAASKGGVMQLTKALSNEWAAKGINVNAIAPGYMATDMNTALLADEKRNAEITARIPAQRWGTEDDMKGPLLFLASDASNYVHGAILPVDGGYLGR